MGVGPAVIKWPLLISHEPWGLAEGAKECLLIAMSVLALLGIRYPLRMLPILLFEVSWKLLRLGVVALPLWSDNQLEGAPRRSERCLAHKRWSGRPPRWMRRSERKGRWLRECCRVPHPPRSTSDPSAAVAGPAGLPHAL